jgi:hypothetical protein
MVVAHHQHHHQINPLVRLVQRPCPPTRYATQSLRRPEHVATRHFDALQHHDAFNNGFDGIFNFYFNRKYGYDTEQDSRDSLVSKIDVNVIVR